VALDETVHPEALDDFLVEITEMAFVAVGILKGLEQEALHWRRWRTKVTAFHQAHEASSCSEVLRRERRVLAVEMLVFAGRLA